MKIKMTNYELIAKLDDGKYAVASVRTDSYDKQGIMFFNDRLDSPFDEINPDKTIFGENLKIIPNIKSAVTSFLKYWNLPKQNIEVFGTLNEAYQSLTKNETIAISLELKFKE